MFSLSADGENYNGRFDTVAAAANIAQLLDYRHFWIGELTPPPAPESLWNAEDWLEHVSVQDEYALEQAADWNGSTEEQRTELEVQVRKVMGEWLDRHGLRPAFFNVYNAKAYQFVGGVLTEIPENV
jgi:hypothetical protein